MDWSWAGPALDVRPLFPRERAELLALLESLDPADWQRSTVCPGWHVHDIAAHLVHDYLRKLSGLRDGFGGPGPRPGEARPAWLHRMNQDFVTVAARWSPRALSDLLAHLGPQLDDLWAGLDLAASGEAVSWAAPGVPAPRWLDAAREYSEYWVHQQQIRDAVQRPGGDDAVLLGPVVDTFLRAVPYALRDEAAAAGSSIQIEISGAGGGSWLASRQDSGWTIRPGHGSAPAATIRLSPDTLWRVATRGITVAAAAGRTQFDGARELGLATLGLVSIIR
jgi:uncharacterized protein (TIGR03083 family)